MSVRLLLLGSTKKHSQMAHRQTDSLTPQEYDEFIEKHAKGTHRLRPDQFFNEIEIVRILHFILEKIFLEYASLRVWMGCVMHCVT